MTYMQEETAKDAAAAAAAAAADAETRAPLGRDGPVAHAVEPEPVVRALCSGLFLPGAASASARRPRDRLTHMGVLAQAGLVRVVSGQTVLLPSGVRVLRKLDQLIDAELAHFRPQSVQLGHDAVANDEHSSSAATPYNAALATNLAQMTALIADDFRAGSLRSAALRTELFQPASSSSSPLWSGSKRTHDVALFDTRHSVGLERYHALVDAFRLSATYACGQAKAVHVVDTAAILSGPAGIDADLAHEVHVEANDGHASSSVMRCSQCEYAAKPNRAVSLPSESTTTASDPSDSIFPPSLEQATQSWAQHLLAQTFPAHVVSRLNLADPASPWKVEMLFEAAPEESDSETEPVERLLYMVLMRRDHEVNLDAVGEHVSVGNLQRVENVGLAIDILRQHAAVDDALLQSIEAETNAATPTSAIHFSSHPELVIDQALIPEDIDLDMAVLEEYAEEEEEQEALDEAESADADADATVDVDPTSFDASSPDASTLSRMEKQFMSSVSKLRPGEAIDMVQVELAAQGLDVAAARAKLAAQAMDSQKAAHDTREQEEMAEAQMQALKERVDADDAAPAYDPTQAPDAEAEVNLAPSAPSEAAVFSALIPHFEYSKQGFFRRAAVGETCAICEKGRLDHVATHIVANSAFIGRQELVRDDNSSSHKRASQRASTTTKFLHTSFGRFSSHDLLAHLATQNLQTPTLPSPSNNNTTVLAAPTVYFPPLIAPYQVALVPVTQAEPTNPRDRVRAPSTPAATAELVVRATEELHDAILHTAAEEAAKEEAAVGVSHRSLSGEMLIDDHYESLTSVRVQRLLSLGVPILLIISPASVEKGYVTLLLNKRGLRVEPRRIAVNGLPELVAKMVESSAALQRRTRREMRQQAQEKKQQEEEMRRMQEEDDMEQQQEEM